MELIERVQPRRLNANQEAHVVESLKASPVRGQVRISYVSGDAEGGTFARQINDILRKAGWPARPLIQIVFASNPVGASILVPELIPQHAEFVRNAFSSVGISLPVRVNKKQPPDTVVLQIGNKPQPEQLQTP